MKTSRRDFLAWSVGAGAAMFAGGCGRPYSKEKGWVRAAGDAGPSALLSRGELLGTVPFIDERGGAVGTLTGQGLGGRLALDLSTLTPETLVTPNDRFFIRTRYPDRLDPDAPWKIAVRGLVDAPATLTLDELTARAEPKGTHLLECAGNTGWRHFGLISAAQWSGVPLLKAVERAKIRRGATRVLVSGFDQHSKRHSGSVAGASWIFTLDELEASGAFLATEMNGKPIPKDHGFPVRLIVPGWYGCSCIKWVDEIVLVDDTVQVTSQMKEFAGRAGQSGSPRLAKDFGPVVLAQAAMPVRVEKWKVDGKAVYRVVGILWGGDRPTNALAIRFNPGTPYEPVRGHAHETNATWTLWTHLWSPEAEGRHRIRLKIDDPAVSTPRLDRGRYDRTVRIGRG